jgi:hypothetical protein
MVIREVCSHGRTFRRVLWSMAVAAVVMGASRPAAAFKVMMHAASANETLEQLAHVTPNAQVTDTLEDGAVVVSDSEALLIAAWPKGQHHHQQVKLPAAPIAVVANREVLSSMVPPGALAPLAQAVDATQRLELTIALAPIDVTATMETASPADGKRVGEFWEQVFVPFRNPATARQIRERLPPLFTDVMQSGSAQTSGSRVQIRFQLPPQAIQSLYHSAAMLAAAGR